MDDALPSSESAFAVWRRALVRFDADDADSLDLGSVVASLKARRPGLHVVVTGRNAKPALIEAADLVTEMGAVKHHFGAGVKAQPGIEF